MRWFYFENGKPYFIYGGTICDFGRYCAATKSSPDYEDFRFFENFGLPNMTQNLTERLDGEVFYVPLAPQRGDRPDCKKEEAVVSERVVHKQNTIDKIFHREGKPITVTTVTKVSNDGRIIYCNYHGKERLFYLHDGKPYFTYQNHYQCKKFVCVFYTQEGHMSLLSSWNDIPDGDVPAFTIEYEPSEELTECKEAKKKYDGKKEEKPRNLWF
ncbi:hypothetical protein Ddc_12104 [Ditylenchus destructor]|nr:hypothetical protein Ddc_12104 [Ditylenchus destructor]